MVGPGICLKLGVHRAAITYHLTVQIPRCKPRFEFFKLEAVETRSPQPTSLVTVIELVFVLENFVQTFHSTMS